MYNLGTGNGQSVLDIVNGMKDASGRDIPYQFAPRRPGDIAICFASPKKAHRELNWSANLGTTEMCRDAWNWQSKNPNGYSKL